MGQYWKIVNIDKAVELAIGGAVKLPELLETGVAEQLVDLLRVPPLLNLQFGKDSVARAKARSLTNGCALITLPQELIDQILAQLGLYEAVFLALSCSFFFRLLGPAVRESVIAFDAPWAGDQLIVVGDYAEGIPKHITLPASLQRRIAALESPRDIAALDSPRDIAALYSPRDSDEEDSIAFASDVDSYSEVRDEYDGEDEDEEDLECNRRNPLYNLIDEQYRPITRWDDGVFHCVTCREVFHWRRHLSTHHMLHYNPSPQTPQLTYADYQLIERLFRPDAQSRPPAYVLRNLNTKEFVTDRALARSKYAYSLGEVICMRAVWTRDPSGTKHTGTNGPWAGCRFDLVDSHLVKGWTDVSREAVLALRSAAEGEKRNGRRA